MELVPVNTEGPLLDFSMATSADLFRRFLDSQRELFHAQVEELQKIVVTQCKLTGVNPLSQEMAAAALSIKIGKRPRDLLNPKAIKYMQSIFSIKDTIGKKETREISALCGATITQVREFFAGQRSRVRKIVRLSREKAIKSHTSKICINGSSSDSNNLPVDNERIPLCLVETNISEESVTAPVNLDNLGASSEEKLIPVDSANVVSQEERAPCSLQNETSPGINSDDKKFLENIFSLMRKEQTFAGQLKLMEWVLQINNSEILYWFLTKGGISILATWLSQAAHEEQTTVILFIFKVLCHLPLHTALPMQLSSILQSVNKLRFYKTSDIANKARFLLSRWSKLFVRSQTVKKSSLKHTENQKDLIRKQRISEMLSDKSCQSKVDIPDEFFALTQEAESNRQLDSKQALKLLPAPGDNLNKKHGRIVSSPKMKERRKVLLVEQPDHTSTGRNQPVSRVVPSRPLSADDIQKAKMRAIFMQNKHGKADVSTTDKLTKFNNKKMPSTSQTNILFPTRKPPYLTGDEDKNPLILTTKGLDPTLDILNDSNASASRESLLEKLKIDQIPWQRPPEMKINCLWSVGNGENSKEVEVQTSRNRREKEARYANSGEIPPDPKEPWDLEMDFDDSLTPQVPIEQPPDADAAGSADGADLPASSTCEPLSVIDQQQTCPLSVIDQQQTCPPAAFASQDCNVMTTEPDLELLSVLLKNPDLVFALTSGQGNTLSETQTVALLDLLKNTGGGLGEILMSGASTIKSEEKPVPTSLPSPTPSTERVMEPAGIIANNLQSPPDLTTYRDAANIYATEGSPYKSIIAREGPLPQMDPFPGSVFRQAQPSVTIMSTSQPTIGIQPPPINLLSNNNPLPTISHQVVSASVPSSSPEPVLPTRPYLPPSLATVSSSSSLHQREICSFDGTNNYQSSYISSRPSMSALHTYPAEQQCSPFRAAPADFGPVLSTAPSVALSAKADPLPEFLHGRQPYSGSSLYSSSGITADQIRPRNGFHVGPSRTATTHHGPALDVNDDDMYDSEFENWRGTSRNRVVLSGRHSARNLYESRRENGRWREGGYDRRDWSRQSSSSGHQSRHRPRRWRGHERRH